MTKTVITGIIADSGDNFLTGVLVVKLAGNMVKTDVTPVQLLTTIPCTFTITSGLLNISLEESETSNITYNFAFYLVDTNGNINGNFVFQFDAIVPNVSTIPITDLVPSGITNDQLDTSILRIAKIISSDPTLVSQIKGAPYPRGAYDPAVTYGYGDMVSYQFRNYINNSTVPIKNILPTDATKWYWLVVEPTGEQIIGDPSIYGDGWISSSLAPTQDTLYGIIETKADKSYVNTLSPTFSPVLSGNPTAPTAIAGNNSLSIANTAFVAAGLALKADLNLINLKAPLLSPSLLGTPTTPTPTVGDNTLTLANTAFVAAGLALKGDLSLVNLKAPLLSPVLSGNPTAPTAIAGDNTNSISTTAFVMAGLALKGDLNLLNLKASSDSPMFTGIPTTVTPSPTDNSKQLANTEFIQNLLSLKAPLGSPIFSGNPTAPNAIIGDNTGSLATTFFVNRAITNKVNLAGDLTGSVETPVLANVLSNPGNFKCGNINVDAKGRIISINSGKLTDLSNIDPTMSPANGNVLTFDSATSLWKSLAPGSINLSSYALLDSPNFIGTPLSPTPPLGDSSKQIATTAFINALLANNPVFGGNPTTTTQGTSDNSTRIATTAFIKALLNSSPIFGGNPTTPTVSPGDNSNNVASTAFIKSLFTIQTISGYTAIKLLAINYGIHLNSSVLVTDANGYGVINFLTSLNFTSVPTVIVSNGDMSAAHANIGTFSTSTTKTYFTINLFGTPNTSCRINWIALGTM